MTLIAHISDLHFGAASQEATAALEVALNRRRPDFVLATGDLTQEGRRKEFEEARLFFKKLSSRVFVIPGNHDVPVRNLWARFTNPYDRFQRFISTDIDPFYCDDQIALVGLNSARRAALDINWSYGRLSCRQIADAAKRLSDAPADALKIIATHHPFELGSGKAGSRIIGRGEEAMQAFADAGLDMAFTGHVHESKASIKKVGERGVLLVQAGTATSVRTRLEAPAFNMVQAGRAEISIEVLSLTQDGFTPTRTLKFASAGADGWRSAE